MLILTIHILAGFPYYITLAFVLKDIFEVRQFKNTFVTHAANPTSLSSAIYYDALNWVISVVGDDSEQFSRKKLDYANETIR